MNITYHACRRRTCSHESKILCRDKTFFFACVYNNHKKNFYPCRVSNFYHINQWNRESFSQRIGPQDIGKGGVNDSYYSGKKIEAHRRLRHKYLNIEMVYD